jgi:hypothetical protein
MKGAMIVISLLIVVMVMILTLRQFQSSPFILQDSKKRSITPLTPQHELPRGYKPCNPSVVKLENGDYLVVYRETNLYFSGFKWLLSALNWKTHLGLMILDQNLAVKRSQTLHLTKKTRHFLQQQCSSVVYGFHDPRITVTKDGRILILAYHVNKLHSVMNLLTLSPTYEVHHLTTLLLGGEEDKPQKNWNFFPHNPSSFETTHLLSTRVEPHQICEMNLETGKVIVVYETSYPLLSFWKKQKRYRIHGGSGVIPVKDQPFFLGAFHIKRGNFLISNYRTVWYLCHSFPPFSIITVSQPFLLPRDPQKNNNNTSRITNNIQMATGITSDDSGDHILLTMGIMDCQCVTLKWNTQSLLDWIRKHPGQESD